MVDPVAVDHRVPRLAGHRRSRRAPAGRLLHGQGDEPVPLGRRPRPQGQGPHPLVGGQQLEVAGDGHAPTRVVEVAAFVHPEARAPLLRRRPPQPRVARAHHDPVAVQHEVHRAHRRRVVVAGQRHLAQAAPLQQSQALRPRQHLEAGLVDDRSLAHPVQSTARARPGAGSKVPPSSGPANQPCALSRRARAPTLSTPWPARTPIAADGEGGRRDRGGVGHRPGHHGRVSWPRAPPSTPRTTATGQQMRVVGSGMDDTVGSTLRTGGEGRSCTCEGGLGVGWCRRSTCDRSANAYVATLTLRSSTTRSGSIRSRR